MHDRLNGIQGPQDFGRDNILTRVREGMDVYDRDGKRVGAVDRVYMGSVGDRRVESGAESHAVSEADAPPEGGLAENLMAAFAADSDLPETIRQRLMYNGFMRVDGHGLLGSGRLVERQQIESVAGDRVILNASQSDLLKG